MATAAAVPSAKPAARRAWSSPSGSAAHRTTLLHLDRCLKHCSRGGSGAGGGCARGGGGVEGRWARKLPPALVHSPRRKRNHTWLEATLLEHAVIACILVAARCAEVSPKW